MDDAEIVDLDWLLRAQTKTNLGFIQGKERDVLNCRKM
jgi:hypothetical protein